eukprot:3935754-Alexandrium_andersonii.AAC.1
MPDPFDPAFDLSTFGTVISQRGGLRSPAAKDQGPPSEGGGTPQVLKRPAAHKGAPVKKAKTSAPPPETETALGSKHFCLRSSASSLWRCAKTGLKCVEGLVGKGSLGALLSSGFQVLAMGVGCGW